MASPITIQRQPTKLDYASPTQFKFGIHQLPKVEFFTTSAQVPAIALSDVVIPTPFKSIPMQGDQLTFDNLTVNFIVDEFLENYLSLHEWMTAIGFPKNRKQFSDFKTNTSNTQMKGQKRRFSAKRVRFMNTHLESRRRRPNALW